MAEASPCDRVLVIGWDGANFDLVRKWAAEGKLPAAARLLAEGSAGHLESTIPPISAPAWSSLATGLNPGRHGIYYFREHVPGSYELRLVKGADRHGKPLWRMLNEQGKQAGVVNLVMTWPPEPLDGFMISGMDAPGEHSDFTYPPELADELRRAVGEYLIELPLEEEARNFRYDALWAKIEQEMEARIAAVRYLLRAKAWDVFVVNFRATDSVQHHFWKFMDAAHPQYDATPAARWGDAIERVYRRLDGFLGDLLAELDESTLVILMSDHGFGPVGDTALYLNKWLAQEGFLKLKAQDGRAAGGSLLAGLRGKLWQGAWVRLRQITPQAVKDLAERLWPRFYQRIRYPAAHFFIDWAESRAYGDEYQESIWINLVGREPQGIVQPGAEYEALRDEIIARLGALRHPHTGEPIIEAAYRREEVYHGSEVGRAPDIVVIPGQEPYVRVRPSHSVADPAPVRTLTPEELRADYLPSGVHRRTGMFLALGPGIRQGHQLPTRHICDVTPTVLAALGCRVPAGLDGRVIEEMFTTPPDVRYFDDVELPPRAEQAMDYSEEEAKLVSEKLKGLGYI
ncbi:MAG: alkaline phosphatase family protein [Chloroflexi bacterium]|nr:alkaline phosphatase family protein [Chloroflexota bacterium]